MWNQGVELEEQDSEQERESRLQRVAEEWNDLLGRSQDSHDLQQPRHSQEAEDNEAERIVAASSSLQNHPQDGSVDSMRTMFSNSVTLPVGTFRELDQSHSATTNNDAKNAVK